LQTKRIRGTKHHAACMPITHWAERFLYSGMKKDRVYINHGKIQIRPL